ncbi:MATH and LRR domain-containing protein PFE0570w-like isoform X2 [Aethina tumida]|nr:MATH and LRR domain-containing protein PFE0570w-like isoform X2 [Aethina tumida]
MDSPSPFCPNFLSPEPEECNAALKAEVLKELLNKKQCANKSYECRQIAVDNYDYCKKHILQDKSAPFKQCAFVYNIKKGVSLKHGNFIRRCHAAVPMGERKDSGFCLQHAWKIYAEKDKNRIPPPRSKEILLNSLNHYLYKPPVKKTVLPYSMPQPKPKPSRRFVPNKSLNPFVDGKPDSIYRPNIVLDVRHDADYEMKPYDVSALYSDDHADCSDNESVDSENEDLLKHACAFTVEEINTIIKRKLIRLQSLYIEQYRYLQYVLKEKRRNYLACLKREKETCSTIYDQVKDNPKEKLLFKKLKAYKRYHKSSGPEAIMNKKLNDIKKHMSRGTRYRRRFVRCSFAADGMKCPNESLPLTKHCRKHIMENKNQVLFKPCGIGKSDIECNTPVEKIYDNCTCKLHTDIPPCNIPLQESVPTKRKLRTQPMDITNICESPFVSQDNKTIADLDLEKPFMVLEPINVIEPSKDAEPYIIAEPFNITEPLNITGPFNIREPFNILEPIDINEPLNINEPFSIIGSFNINEPFTITEPFTIEEPFTITEAFNITEPLIISEPFDIIEAYDITEPVNITNPNNITEPLKITQPLNITPSCKISEPFNATKTPNIIEPHINPFTIRDPFNLLEAVNITEPFDKIEPINIRQPFINTESNNNTRPFNKNEPFIKKYQVNRELIKKKELLNRKDLINKRGPYNKHLPLNKKGTFNRVQPYRKELIDERMSLIKRGPIKPQFTPHNFRRFNETVVNNNEPLNLSRFPNIPMKRKSTKGKIKTLLPVRPSKENIKTKLPGKIFLRNRMNMNLNQTKMKKKIAKHMEENIPLNLTQKTIKTILPVKSVEETVPLNLTTDLLIPENVEKQRANTDNFENIRDKLRQRPPNTEMKSKQNKPKSKTKSKAKQSNKKLKSKEVSKETDTKEKENNINMENQEEQDLIDTKIDKKQKESELVSRDSGETYDKSHIHVNDINDSTNLTELQQPDVKNIKKIFDSLYMINLETLREINIEIKEGNYGVIDPKDINIEDIIGSSNLIKIKTDIIRTVEVDSGVDVEGIQHCLDVEGPAAIISEINLDTVKTVVADDEIIDDNRDTKDDKLGMKEKSRKHGYETMDIKVKEGFNVMDTEDKSDREINITEEISNLVELEKHVMHVKAEEDKFYAMNMEEKDFGKNAERIHDPLNVVKLETRVGVIDKEKECELNVTNIEEESHMNVDKIYDSNTEDDILDTEFLDFDEYSDNSDSDDSDINTRSGVLQSPVCADNTYEKELYRQKIQSYSKEKESDNHEKKSDINEDADGGQSDTDEEQSDTDEEPSDTHEEPSDTHEEQLDTHEEQSDIDEEKPAVLKVLGSPIYISDSDEERLDTNESEVIVISDREENLEKYSSDMECDNPYMVNQKEHVDMNIKSEENVTDVEEGETDVVIEETYYSSDYEFVDFHDLEREESVIDKEVEKTSMVESPVVTSPIYVMDSDEEKLLIKERCTTYEDKSVTNEEESDSNQEDSDSNQEESDSDKEKSTTDEDEDSPIVVDNEERESSDGNESSDTNESDCKKTSYEVVDMEIEDYSTTVQQDEQFEYDDRENEISNMDIVGPKVFSIIKIKQEPRDFDELPREYSTYTSNIVQDETFKNDNRGNEIPNMHIEGAAEFSNIKIKQEPFNFDDLLIEDSTYTSNIIQDETFENDNRGNEISNMDVEGVEAFSIIKIKQEPRDFIQQVETFENVNRGNEISNMHIEGAAEFSNIKIKQEPFNFDDLLIEDSTYTSNIIQDETFENDNRGNEISNMDVEGVEAFSNIKIKQESRDFDELPRKYSTYTSNIVQQDETFENDNRGNGISNMYVEGLAEFSNIKIKQEPRDFVQQVETFENVNRGNEISNMNIEGATEFSNIKIKQEPFNFDDLLIEYSTYTSNIIQDETFENDNRGNEVSNMDVEGVGAFSNIKIKDEPCDFDELPRDYSTYYSNIVQQDETFENHNRGNEISNKDIEGVGAFSNIKTNQEESDSGKGKSTTDEEEIRDVLHVVKPEHFPIVMYKEERESSDGNKTSYEVVDMEIEDYSTTVQQDEQFEYDDRENEISNMDILRPKVFSNIKIKQGPRDFYELLGEYSTHTSNIVQDEAFENDKGNEISNTDIEGLAEFLQIKIKQEPRDLDELPREYSTYSSNIVQQDETFENDNNGNEISNTDIEGLAEFLKIKIKQEPRDFDELPGEFSTYSSNIVQQDETFENHNRENEISNKDIEGVGVFSNIKTNQEESESDKGKSTTDEEIRDASHVVKPEHFPIVMDKEERELSDGNESSDTHESDGNKTSYEVVDMEIEDYSTTVQQDEQFEYDDRENEISDMDIEGLGLFSNIKIKQEPLDLPKEYPIYTSNIVQQGETFENGNRRNEISNMCIEGQGEFLNIKIKQEPLDFDELSTKYSSNTSNTNMDVVSLGDISNIKIKQEPLDVDELPKTYSSNTSNIVQDETLDNSTGGNETSNMDIVGLEGFANIKIRQEPEEFDESNTSNTVKQDETFKNDNTENNTSNTNVVGLEGFLNIKIKQEPVDFDKLPGEYSSNTSNIKLEEVVKTENGENIRKIKIKKEPIDFNLLNKAIREKYTSAVLPDDLMSINPLEPLFTDVDVKRESLAAFEEREQVILSHTITESDNEEGEEEEGKKPPEFGGYL